MGARRTERKASPFLELALDQVASLVVHANDGIVALEIEPAED
jgi:hypothetical protein